jgi:hypothetical protein
MRERWVVSMPIIPQCFGIISLVMMVPLSLLLDFLLDTARLYVDFRDSVKGLIHSSASQVIYPLWTR